MDNTKSQQTTDNTNTGSDKPQNLGSEAELDSFITKADVTLVEFYTDGCRICSSMDPVLGNIARALDISVGLINPRDDPPLIERFEVRSVPLLVLFVDGEPVSRLEDGFVSGDELTTWIRDVQE